MGLQERVNLRLGTNFNQVSMYLQNLILTDEQTVFTSPTGDGTAIFTWSSELRKGLAVYIANSSSTIGSQLC